MERYIAPCGAVINRILKTGEKAKKYHDIILETDKPLPGASEPVKIPNFCDPQCLHKKKPELFELAPDIWEFVSAYKCRFIRDTSQT